jgi:O-antigen/teichoic acid export membrane protein
MSAEKVETIPTIDHKPHAAFFRQSGWLMIANIIAGLMAMGVHLLAKKVSEAEYSIFGTMLMITACVPMLPLQMVFAQQTARTLATNRSRQLAGMIRLGWLWTSILWAVAAVIVVAFQSRIMARWELTSSVTLWITLGAVLMNLWSPLFSGVMQGRQDFFWLGWAMILNGVGRVVVAVLLVMAFHGGATAMILGALVGLGAWSAIGIWRSRDLWLPPPEKFDRRALLKQAVPLFLGFGACQFLFTTDTMFAKAFFSGNEMASYVAAGTLSRALLWLVLPLATVMFPKIVHSTAKSEKSNLLGIVLLGTAALAVCGAAGLCLVGPFVVKLIYTKDYGRSDDATAAVVCGRDDSAGAGKRAGERLDGARKIQNCSADRAADHRLRIHAAIHAAQISRTHGSGAANARRIQPCAAGHLRVVRFFKPKGQDLMSRTYSALDFEPWICDCVNGVGARNFL